MGGDRSLLPDNKRQDKRKPPQVTPGEVYIGHEAKHLHCKGGQALEEAAHGGGGITSPGGVSEIYKCSAWGQDLVMKLAVLR